MKSAPVAASPSEGDAWASLLPEPATWRAVRVAQSNEAQRALAALRAGRWAQPPTCIKREGAKAIHLGQLETQAGLTPVALKVRPWSRWRVLGSSQCARQWRGAERLAAAGVAVAAPLALLRETGGPAGPPAREALLLAQLPGADLIRALASGALDDASQRRVARDAGALAGRIADARLRFRDLKLSNIILMEDGALGLVDTVGVRRIGAGARARQRALERMLLAMLKEAAGTGLLPARAQRLRCLRAAWGRGAPKQVVRASWRRLDAALARAGDTTPRVDPRPNRC